MEPNRNIPAGKIRSRLEHLVQVDRVELSEEIESEFHVHLTDGDTFRVGYETIRDVWHMDDETMINQLRGMAQREEE